MSPPRSPVANRSVPIRTGPRAVPGAVSGAAPGIAAQIASQFTYRNSLGLMGLPTRGQFVIMGPREALAPAENRIGFCVQIRKKGDQDDSSMVFLRHPDGTLTTPENQCFCVMTPAQELLARSIFKRLPEDEVFSLGYACSGNIREVGFLIEDSASDVAAGGNSFLMARAEEVQRRARSHHLPSPKFKGAIHAH